MLVSKFKRSSKLNSFASRFVISAFVFYRLIYLLKKKRKKYARVRLHVSYLLRYLSMGIIQKTSIEIFCSLNKKKKKKEKLRI